MFKYSLAILLFYITSGFGVNFPDKPSDAIVEVVYPRDRDEQGFYHLRKGIDSTFLLGNVRHPLSTKLTINQQMIPIDSGGGWLAWVKCPSKNRDFTWNVKAISDSDTMFLKLPVKRVSPIRESLREINLTKPIWVQTLKSARLQLQPGGKNFLLPIEKTQLKIIKTKGDYWATNSFPNQILWVNKSFVEETSIQQSSSIRLISYQTDSTTNRLKIRFFLNSPPLVYFSSDTIKKQSASFTLVCDAIDSLSPIGYQDSLFEVKLNRKKTGFDFVCLSKLGSKFIGYSFLTDSNFVDLNLKFSPYTNVNDTLPLLGWRIAIDPGHGGEQYGAIGPTWLSEKKVNLQVSNLLRRKLCYLGATAFLTRTNDTELELSERIRIADSDSVHIFISIHQNALPDGENPWFQTGTSTYYFHSHSYSLASFVHQSLLEKLDLTDRGLYVGDFAVVRYAGALSILTEASYMIRPDHERKLKSPVFLKNQADAIASGIVKYVQSK